MKTVLFHSNQLSLRGTEVALYDYAYFNQTLLGNRSMVCVPSSGSVDPAALKKFEADFPVHRYQDPADLEGFVKAQGVDVLYSIKYGINDGFLVRGVRNCVHVVFKAYEPHGDVYAYISRWLAEEMSGGRSPFVPHLVRPHVPAGDLREELGIPSSALVFGRYGGLDTFDIPFVHEVIFELASRRKDFYFLFMNTDDFVSPLEGRSSRWFSRGLEKLGLLPSDRSNIRFLPGDADPVRKARFIQTCDAMLHARARGETFGLACGEFSVANKPVITWKHDDVPERCHFEILGQKGLYYSDKASLKGLLTSFRPDPSRDWDAYTQDYNPQTVMEQFDRIFLQGVPG